MSPSRQREAWIELDARDNDGLAVSLLWSETTGRTRVIVVDQMFKAELLVDVPPACALDAFYHPFTYAGRAPEPTCATSEPSTPSRHERSAA